MQNWSALVQPLTIRFPWPRGRREENSKCKGEKVDKGQKGRKAANGWCLWQNLLASVTYVPFRSQLFVSSSNRLQHALERSSHLHQSCVNLVSKPAFRVWVWMCSKLALNTGVLLLALFFSTSGASGNKYCWCWVYTFKNVHEHKMMHLQTYRTCYSLIGRFRKAPTIQSL